MHPFFSIFCFIAALASSHAAGQWPAEKARQWYDSQPWPCGYNYIPAHAINYTEMWMPGNFDAAKIDKELALSQDVGFNCLRVVLPFVVWEHDPAAFKKRLEDFLAVCDRRGHRVMFALFDDCGEVTNPKYGPQPEVVEGWYANAWSSSPGHDMVRDPKTWPRLEKYLRDIVTTFRDDRRVWVWDLYNEPTNSGTGKAALPLAEKVFEWARSINPTQPLTIGTWNSDKSLNDIIFRHSDIITFHSYSKPEKVADLIRDLKIHARPIINTEWLNRPGGSSVEGCLPVFTADNVGCMHWGLVNGRTQTHLKWGARPDKPVADKWQHDIFKGDHTPYDPAEIALFRKTIAEQRKRD
jgi:hypothetical protein